MEPIALMERFLTFRVAFDGLGDGRKALQGGGDCGGEHEFFDGVRIDRVGLREA